jgi:ankyrin repeat protein
VLNHAANPHVAGLLLERGADPHRIVYPAWDWTPLHEAAFRGRLAILERLAAEGRNLSSITDGTTPLHAAARMGHAPVVGWLLERGVAVDSRGRGGPWQGKTALAIAIEHDHEEVAALLRRAQSPPLK